MDERVEKLSLIKKGQKRVKYTNGEQELVLPPKRISKVLDQTDILASTTTMAGNLIIKNTEFDTIILDEAGQISEPTALNSLLKGKKYILVGDHMQLPPISNIELDNVPEESQKYFDLLHFSKEKHLSQSIFERLVHHYREKDHCFSLLSYQYRMNKTISKFISEHFYEGKLRSGEIKGKSIGEQKFSQFLATLNLKISIFQQNEGEKHEKKGKFGQLVFGSDLPMIFLDTMEIQMFDSTIDEESKDLESKFNRGEGKIIAHLMLWFVSKILKNTRYIEIEEWENIFSNIGIISPYRAQNQKIREMIKQGINNKLAYVKKEKDTIINKEDIIESIMNNLTVDTVDRFQGGEKEIIIYSFVDSNRDRTLSSLHLEIRRLNVSISRAKKKIIFVGNSQTLCTNKNEKNEEISEKKGDNGSKLERHSRPHRKIKVKNLYRDLKNYIEQNEGYQKLAQDTLDGENKNERTHHIGKK